MPRPADRAPFSGSTRTMPRLLIILAGVFLAARIVLGIVEKKEDEQAGSAAADSLELVHWVSPDSAEVISTMTGKPILYDFAAGWCGPCKMMKAEVFRDKESAAFINESFVPARVIDRAREDGKNVPVVDALQKRYRIRAFPTLVVATKGGEPAYLEGYAGKAETMRQLRAAAASH